MIKEIIQFNLHFIKYNESVDKLTVFYTVQFDLTYKKETDEISKFPYIIATVFYDTNKVSLALVNIKDQRLYPAQLGTTPKILEKKILETIAQYEKDADMRRESLERSFSQHISLQK